MPAQPATAIASDANIEVSQLGGVDARRTALILSAP